MSIESINLDILSITKKETYLRADDLFIICERDSQYTAECSVWIASSEPKLIQIVNIETNAQVNIENIDPKIIAVLQKIASEILPKWDYLERYMRQKEVVKLFKETDYKGQPPTITSTDELSSAVAKMILRNYIVKTFATGKDESTSARRGAVIDIYCYEKTFYRSCRNELKKYVGELSREISILGKKLSEELMNRILFKVASETITEINYGHRFRYLALGNKILDWWIFTKTWNLTDALEDPDPNKHILNKIDYGIDLDAWRKIRIGLERYIPPRSCEELNYLMKQLAPATYEYLRSIAWFEGIDPKLLELRICFLIQLIGRMLLPGYRVPGKEELSITIHENLKNVFALIGPPNTGKSTFLIDYVGRTVLGYENFKITNLARLGSRNPDEMYKEAHDIRDALMVVHPDITKRTKIENWSIIKTISGGDPVKARGLFKDAYEYYPAYKIVIASNDPPEIEDEGEGRKAVLERLRVIELRNIFKGQKLDLSKLGEEVSRALIVYLYSLYLVINQNYWAPTGVRDIEDLWLRYSDTVYKIITDMIYEGILIKGRNEKIETKDLYLLVSRYIDCRGLRYSLPDQGVFTKRLKMHASKLEIEITRKNTGETVVKGLSKAKDPCVGVEKIETEEPEEQDKNHE